MKRHAPATDRNRDPILAVLTSTIGGSPRVLEVASGTGQHAAYFAAHLPHVTWQPSDPDPAARASIAAWIAESGAGNLRAPIALDAAAPPWDVDGADAVVCINMVHIAPWTAALGLFAGAAELLPTGAPLVTYGPYRFAGAFTAPSNEAFDRELREQNPAWGVRDVNDLEAAAVARGFVLEDVVAMPANNHCLIFRRAA
jgi:SAM-dependent methyltransferase